MISSIWTSMVSSKDSTLRKKMAQKEFPTQLKNKEKKANNHTRIPVVLKRKGKILGKPPKTKKMMQSWATICWLLNNLSKTKTSHTTRISCLTTDASDLKFWRKQISFLYKFRFDYHISINIKYEIRFHPTSRPSACPSNFIYASDNTK